MDPTAGPGAVELGIASSDDDLRDILALQTANLERELSPDDARSQGFVTLRHDLDALRDMNRAEPHVVARSAGRVVGYALVMLPRFWERVPELAHMRALLAERTHRGRPIEELRYFIMGQVCVDRAFRGRGVFAALYAHMHALYAGRYDAVVTEAATRNTRSVHAHAKVGFELLHRYATPAGESWDLILWDWR
ncbi:MAG: GNAT family N-acetyltransferase [Planctomycetota bacterium]